MSFHLLTKFEIQKNYQNPRFNGGYSRNNLPIIINGSYIINLDECKLIGTHWIALYVNDYNGTYYIFQRKYYKKNWIFISKKNWIHSKNVIDIKISQQIQSNDSIMCDTFVLDLLILC